MVISTIIAGIGLGLTAFGLFEQQEAAEEAREAQQTSTIAQNEFDVEALNIQKRADRVFNRQIRTINQSQQEISEASVRAEEARLRQQNLEASRLRRDVIRQAIIARGTAINDATNQGIGFGGSSILPAAVGSIASAAAFQNLGIFQSQDLGDRIFAANRSIFEAQTRENLAKARITQADRAAQTRIREAQAAAGITSRSASLGVDPNAGRGAIGLGTALTQNAQTITNIGSTLFSKSSTTSSLDTGIPLPTRNPLR